MGKWSLKIAVTCLSIILLFILFNRLDTPLSKDNIQLKDIPPATFNPDNGYYLLYAMTEPTGVDIRSQKIIDKYRKLFDTTIDYKSYQKKMDFFHPRKFKKSSTYRKLRRLNLKFPREISRSDWCQQVWEREKQLDPLDRDLQTLYSRNQILLDCSIFEEFILVEVSSPIPNLLVWLNTSRLHVGVNMLKAMKGKWQEGVNQIIKQLDFSRRAVRGSRALITNLVAKAVMHISIQGLASLINLKECPRTIFQHIIERLSPLAYMDFGSHVSLKGELLAFTEDYVRGAYHQHEDDLTRLIVSLFMTKNATRNLANAFFKYYINLEKTPPFRWQEQTTDYASFTGRSFWWLKNAGGKILLGKWTDYQTEGKLLSVIHKSYRLKTMHDMLIIACHLHMSYRPGQPVARQLSRLEVYQALTDPCSGKPYRWNDAKQLLYSIGVDRQDNQGETKDYQQIKGSDYAMPVFLYLK
jgi:hypothetical protein